LREQLKEAKKAQKVAAAAAAAAASVAPMGSAEVRAEIAKVKKAAHERLVAAVKDSMNGAYYALASDFDADSTYDGKSAMKIIKSTIKAATLDFLRSLQPEESEPEPEPEPKPEPVEPVVAAEPVHEEPEATTAESEKKDEEKPALVDEDPSPEPAHEEPKPAEAESPIEEIKAEEPGTQPQAEAASAVPAEKEEEEE